MVWATEPPDMDQDSFAPLLVYARAGYAEMVQAGVVRVEREDELNEHRREQIQVRRRPTLREASVTIVVCLGRRFPRGGNAVSSFIHTTCLPLHSSCTRRSPAPRGLHTLRTMDSRQTLLFDADAHHVDESDTSSDTIEMTGMEEIPVTPARRNNYGTSHYGDGPHDSEDESDSDDAGDQALLGLHSRTRGRERSEDGKPTVFRQVKRIVIEVSSIWCYISRCMGVYSICRLPPPSCLRRQDCCLPEKY